MLKSFMSKITGKSDQSSNSKLGEATPPTGGKSPSFGQSSSSSQPPSRPVQPQPRPRQPAELRANASQQARPVRRPDQKSPAPRRENTNVAPVRRELRGGRAAPASEEEVTQLLNLSGELLTAPSGAYPLTDTLRQYVALFSPNGEPSRNILAIASGYQVHPDTSSAKSHLRQGGQSWVKEALVDMDVIRLMYSKHEQRHGTYSNASKRANSPVNDAAVRQKEFLSLIQHAADMNASDIHITIGRNLANIRFRVDGSMKKMPDRQDLPTAVANELCMAAFAMADSSDATYNPMEYQGARVTDTSLKGLRFPDGVQSVRLQFNPLPSGGRYMIARLLYSQKLGSKSDVDQLGYAPVQVRQIRSMRSKPYGINVICGPTGSGKSTTLQRGLTALMREKPGLNVVTIEDPPEYVIEGAAQMPVTDAKTAEERSEKFRQAITASLRSDPDVIMIGEIRDQASSQLAFEAAMTGHGVWTSLHANDAPSILDRLRDQKVEVYKLCDATLVTGLIGQRLLKKNIPDHAVSFEEGVSLGFISKETENFMRDHAARWLDNVRFAGTHLFGENPSDAYTGRRVVAEVIEPDQRFMDFIKEERKPEAVNYWKEHLNGLSMLEHAFALVCLGELDIREMEDKVGRVIDIDPERIPRIIELATREF